MWLVRSTYMPAWASRAGCLPLGSIRIAVAWSIYEVSDYLGCGSYGSRVVPEVECTS